MGWGKVMIVIIIIPVAKVQSSTTRSAEKPLVEDSLLAPFGNVKGGLTAPTANHPHPHLGQLLAWGRCRFEGFYVFL